MSAENNWLLIGSALRCFLFSRFICNAPANGLLGLSGYDIGEGGLNFSFPLKSLCTCKRKDFFCLIKPEKCCFNGVCQDCARNA